ncbi:hypothetical protein H5410_027883 [Solanum commersonii]|uniref:Uncharacterized protein n=1 Tax=Solanum commersonii TaxID=4109 RepID=A0A9J5Z3D2_SOLCO|nr:hypothetical protein H5410_027883 [Solanum commersonii]
MVTYYQCKLHDRRIIQLEDFGLVHSIVRMRATSLDGGIVKMLIYDPSTEEGGGTIEGEGGSIVEGDDGGTVVDWSLNEVLEVSEGPVVGMEGKVEVRG